VRHTQAHLTRAVLEGVSFGLRDSMELVLGAGLGAVDQVRASGGGTRSPLWRQILADVMGVELVMVNTTEGAAYGAALLAGVGAGSWGSVGEACDASVKVLDKTEPNPQNVSLYNDFYRQYRALYPALKPTFDAVSKL
jgi:xylulokinase